MSEGSARTPYGFHSLPRPRWKTPPFLKFFNPRFKPPKPDISVSLCFFSFFFKLYKFQFFSFIPYSFSLYPSSPLFFLSQLPPTLTLSLSLKNPVLFFRASCAFLLSPFPGNSSFSPSQFCAYSPLLKTTPSFHFGFRPRPCSSTLAPASLTRPISLFLFFSTLRLLFIFVLPSLPHTHTHPRAGSGPPPSRSLSFLTVFLFLYSETWNFCIFSYPPVLPSRPNSHSLFIFLSFSFPFFPLSFSLSLFPFFHFLLSDQRSLFTSLSFFPFPFYRCPSFYSMRGVFLFFCLFPD